VNTLNLARIANHELLNAFGQNRDTDRISLAMYLVKKLMAIADEDEDYGCLEDIVDYAMMDEDARLLDLFHEEGINFIEPYYGGRDGVSCLRDKCLECCRSANVIKKFIDLGVNMERAVIAGRTPACILADNQSCGAEVFRMFSVESMEQRDNTGRAAIHYAAAGGNADALNIMLQKGVNAGLTQDAPAEAGNTPLHLACIYGKTDIARALIEFGADDTARNTNGETPAHYIVMENQHRSELSTEERKELLSILPDIGIARNDGKTPLMLLMTLEVPKVDKKELLPVLFEKGARINRTDNEGNTALLLCVQTCRWSLELLKALCKAGADLNAVDRDGNNVLYYVLKNGSEEAASYLLKKGADYNRINRDGVSPAQVAVEKGYDTLLSLMPDIR
ncbi:MAG: ankyrin repeat domain-containing protein, partial [Lachnospiraceae bacterium]|nr:ankyrin repeat domain-containing protein [Lachnospiraceae bacterium]